MAPLTQQPMPTGGSVKGGPTPATQLDTTTLKPTPIKAGVQTEMFDFNVIFMVLDDIGLEKFQAYITTAQNPGYTVARIPNIKTHVIDRGVTFHRAMVAPICGNFRACVTAELYPHHSGLMANIDPNPAIPAGNFYVGQDPTNLGSRTPQIIQCLPTAIRRGRPTNVYKLGKFGKSHMQQEDYYDWMCQGEGWDIFQGHMENLSSYSSWKYIDSSRAVDGTVTTAITDPFTGDLLEKELANMQAWLTTVGSSPFVMFWCPNPPHTPYVVPDPTRVSGASQTDWTTAFAPDSYPAQYTDYSADVNSDPTDAGQIKRVAQRIMTQKHSMEALDSIFGDLVATLQSNNQYDKTVFIVVNDNGTEDPVQEGIYKNGRGKKTVYPQGVQSPCWIGGPVCGQVPRNSFELFNCTDIGTTIRDICGVYSQGADADLILGGHPRDGFSILAHLRDPSKKSLRPINFSMIGGPRCGFGFDPVKKNFNGSQTTTSWTVSDGAYTLCRIGGTVVIDHLYAHTDFIAANDLAVIDPTNPLVVAALAKLRGALNQIVNS